MFMKKEQIKHMINLCFFPVLLIVLGLVLALRPDSAVALLTRVLGWILILGGVGKVLAILAFRDYYGLVGWLWAAVFLATGIFFLTDPLILAKSIGLVVGILLIVEGVDGLRTALRLKAVGLPYLTGLILGIVTLAAGMVLILVPMTASRVAITICGVVITIVGIVNLVGRIRDIRRLDAPDDPDIIDVDE